MGRPSAAKGAKHQSAGAVGPPGAMVALIEELAIMAAELYVQGRLDGLVDGTATTGADVDPSNRASTGVEGNDER